MWQPARWRAPATPHRAGNLDGTSSTHIGHAGV
ncbi:hypothetical protein BDFB_000060 [Asbolus verrucosus]|uniref:Uncharacterized protein n=1 Tax=Asbolus verrucosus TaxID=1661398 RepID=A0A482VHU8_ASBVE|nr:hypothetical protein BDFB_000060 [Asbolus verrucosus]